MNKTAEITQVAVLACLGCLIKSSYGYGTRDFVLKAYFIQRRVVEGALVALLYSGFMEGIGKVGAGNSLS